MRIFGIFLSLSILSTVALGAELPYEKNFVADEQGFYPTFENNFRDIIATVNKVMGGAVKLEMKQASQKIWVAINDRDDVDPGEKMLPKFRKIDREVYLTSFVIPGQVQPSYSYEVGFGKDVLPNLAKGESNSRECVEANVCRHLSYILADAVKLESGFVTATCVPAKGEGEGKFCNDARVLKLTVNPGEQ